MHTRTHTHRPAERARGRCHAGGRVQEVVTVASHTCHSRPSAALPFSPAPASSSAEQRRRRRCQSTYRALLCGARLRRSGHGGGAEGRNGENGREEKARPALASEPNERCCCCCFRPLSLSPFLSLGDPRAPSRWRLDATGHMRQTARSPREEGAGEKEQARERAARQTKEAILATEGGVYVVSLALSLPSPLSSSRTDGARAPPAACSGRYRTCTLRGRGQGGGPESWGSKGDF